MNSALQMKFTSFIFIFLFALASCTSKQESILKHADSVMESDPDSAMSLLQKIDRSRLTATDLPYYALLYTQAQIKTDILLDSDSLISIAYDKYGSSTKSDRGLRSNFYTGEVLFNRKKHPQAMLYYLTVYEDSKRSGNIYWTAKAAERISDLFFFAYNYDEASKYAFEAAILFKKEGRKTFHRYTLGKLANIHANNGDAIHAIEILDSLKNVVLHEQPVDSAFLYYIQTPLLYAKLHANQLDNIDFEGLDFFKNNIEIEDSIDSAILQSFVYNNIGHPEESTKKLNDLEAMTTSDEDKVHILYALYQNAKALGNQTIAISFVDSLLFYQSVVAEDILKESITGAQRDFYSQQTILHKKKNNLLKIILYILVFVFILTVVFIVIVIRLRHKTQKARIDANIEAMLSLKSYSDRIKREKDTAVSQLNMLVKEKDNEDYNHALIVEKLFKEKWSTMDLLCNQYFSLNNTEITEKGILNNIEKEVKRIVSKKGLEDIVSAVDEYMGGIITLLRKQCPFLKEEDINYIALSFAGFSSRSVCLFTGIKYKHYYVKKARLIEKIKKSEAKDKDNFLSKMK